MAKVNIKNVTTKKKGRFLSEACPWGVCGGIRNKGNSSRSFHNDFFAVKDVDILRGKTTSSII